MTKRPRASTANATQCGTSPPNNNSTFPNNKLF